MKPMLNLSVLLLWRRYLCRSILLWQLTSTSRLTTTSAVVWLWARTISLSQTLRTIRAVSIAGLTFSLTVRVHWYQTQISRPLISMLSNAGFSAANNRFVGFFEQSDKDESSFRGLIFFVSQLSLALA